MTFDRDLANELLGTKDRDKALFFAGRQREIEAFDAALRDAEKSRQAIFRIYQGAPGCGKTSLAEHLAIAHPERLFFVHLDSGGPNDASALTQQIRNEAIARGSAAAQIAALFADLAGAHLNSRAISDSLRSAAAKHAADGARLVLHLDEAHAEAPFMEPLLRRLHKVGIGVPCVMLMTGLGHTSTSVTSIDGLSRLQRGAVVEMGAMAHNECADSTHKMLDVLNVSGEEAERDSLAQLTAELAYGWPQHLQCAQTALCEELTRTNGLLRDVDWRCVETASDAKRYEYYKERIRQHPIFDFNERLTMRILADVAAASLPRYERAELEKLCEAAIKRAGLTEASAFKELPNGAFSTALIEKGILSGASGQWEVAIPSMVNWAENAIGH